ncbi:MAG: type VII secretion protein EccC, partial [Myxococcales bacterium]
MFERFKAALVSSPYVPPAEEMKTTVPVVPYVAVNGLGAWIAAQQAEGDAEPALVEGDTGVHGSAKAPSVLDMLCRQIERSGAAPVRPVWLDPLPTHLPLGTLIDIADNAAPRTCMAVFGTVDDPKHQSQFPLEWDFTGAGANLVIVGSPSTGKSTLVRTMVTSMSARYAPGDVAFYIIDYGGGSLSPLAALPHVATVTSRVDPERIQRTVNDVRTTLNRREQLFREKGIDSMAAFRRARENGDLPGESGDVFLIVDGWGTFREEYDDLDYAVADIAARGANFGVHVIVTVTQGMQVRMRMMSAMGGRIELRMNDAYDSEFERKMMEQVPKETIGRGLTGDRKSALIFQTALPALGLPELAPGEDYDDSHLQAGQSELLAAISDKWGDLAVDKVEVLPSVVRLSELPALRKGADQFVVGLSEMNLGPAAISLMGSEPHLQ